MYIYSAFDGGNIAVQSISNPQAISLEIEKDNQSDFFQWFSFRLNGKTNQKYTLRICNAHKSSYPKGWNDYQARYSYDGMDWRQAQTKYIDGELVIEHTLVQNTIQFAYFAPYSLERHENLLRWAQSQGAQRTCLGYTVQKRSIDLLQVGSGEKIIWLVARQHPGETMAEWWMEGFIHKLLDKNDPVSASLLQRATVYMVPNMNPDGSYLGNLRTNAAGINLNRAWSNPDVQTAPEVYWVRKKIHDTGLDFCLDIHGDEGLPYNFLAGPHGIPSLTSRQEDIFDAYEQYLLQHSPDFQTQYGYPKTPKGSSDRFHCDGWRRL